MYDGLRCYLFYLYKESKSKAMCLVYHFLIFCFFSKQVYQTSFSVVQHPLFVEGRRLVGKKADPQIVYLFVDSHSAGCQMKRS